MGQRDGGNGTNRTTTVENLFSFRLFTSIPIQLPEPHYPHTTTDTSNLPPSKLHTHKRTDLTILSNKHNHNHNSPITDQSRYICTSSEGVWVWSRSAVHDRCT